MNGKDNIDIFAAGTDTALDLPYTETGIKAGFPSPAEDCTPLSLDLNKYLIRHPSATFYARASGDSMTGAGISDGDLLIIDRAVDPYDGCVAVVFLNGEFTLKYLHTGPEGITLMPANPEYPPIKVDRDEQFEIWGVVRYVIKKV